MQKAKGLRSDILRDECKEYEFIPVFAYKRLSRAFGLVQSSHVGCSMRTNPIRAPFVVFQWSRSSGVIVHQPCSLSADLPSRGNIREIAKNAAGAKVSSFLVSL